MRYARFSQKIAQFEFFCAFFRKIGKNDHFEWRSFQKSEAFGVAFCTRNSVDLNAICIVFAKSYKISIFGGFFPEKSEKQ